MLNKKNITIKDIARLAGVSTGTVDRVLHNRGRISEDALKRVNKVLEEIDYKPNIIAQTLGSNKTYRIAALIPNPEQDSYWMQSRAGILQAEAAWAHYNVQVNAFLFDLYNKESLKLVAKAIYDAKPDGILIAPIFYHEALPFFKLYKTSNIPYILFNTNITEVNPLSFIGQNLYQSGRVGAELIHIGLHDAGTLAVLHIDEDIQNSIHLYEKERGFREYFSGKYNPELEIKTLNLGSAQEAGFENQMLDLVKDEKLKGIFVTTSKGSSIAASFLEKHNAKHIVMVGYDMLKENIQYLRSGTINFLINQNPKQQAFLGINYLANHLVFKKDVPAQDLLPLDVITRENLQSYLESSNH
jgi:LacI family transcriptional regulator